MSESESSILGLNRLFGADIVEQAQLIDVVDLNLDDRMTAGITTGLTRLKQSRDNPGTQQAIVAAMGSGEKLLLCMWVMELGLLDKLQSHTDG
jgi:hypothetical protein